MGKRGGKGKSAIDSYRGGSPSPGAVGSYESVNRPYYPTVNEGGGTGVRTLRSPALAATVDHPAMGSFHRLLALMDKSGFRTVLSYKGPDAGGTDIGDEGVPLEGLLKALEGMGPGEYAGKRLAAVLRDEHDPEVVARVDVRAGKRTRLKVKVKGRLSAYRWEALRRLVARRFKLAR